METPGSTHGSIAVSNARIRSSRSSSLIAPPLDHEAAGLVDPDVVEFIEPLPRGGEYDPARRPEDPPQRPLPGGGTPLVPPLAVLAPGLEVVADPPEAGLLGGPDVDLPL